MTIHRCDRCGKEYDPDREQRTDISIYEYAAFPGPRFFNSFNLCPCCTRALRRWMKTGGNKLTPLWKEEFEILDKKDDFDQLYGWTECAVTREDIEALQNGKRLYSSMGGYYAITIVMEGADDAETVHNEQV